MKTIKVHFIDGTFTIYRTVVEFFCGYDFFCIVDLSDNSKPKDKEASGRILDRNFIDYVELKYDFGYKRVSLKKRDTNIS